MLETLQTRIFELEQFANTLVSNQLTHLSFVSIGVIFIAGLLTSLTPCMLSMLPITIGYIGGYEAKSRLQAAAQSTWFALGLATTLAGLGIIAATVGKVYGQIGIGLPIIISILAILMGLNLLEALPLQFPSFNDTKWISEDLPSGVRAYAIGLSFVTLQYSSFSKFTGLGCQYTRFNFRCCFINFLHSWLCSTINFGRYIYCFYKKNIRIAALFWLD